MTRNPSALMAVSYCNALSLGMPMTLSCFMSKPATVNFLMAASAPV